MSFRTVLFDLGGVVLGSPFSAIASYEQELGLAPGCITGVIARGGSDSAWSRLERGELSVSEFAPCFEAESQRVGVTLSGEHLIDAIMRATRPRSSYLRAIDIIRAHGLKAAALTNNWRDDASHRLSTHFDLFLESSKLGMRKPDPRVYVLACEQLHVDASEVVYLDDIGSNLKPARALGMTTIKVDDPDAALQTLETLLGLTLR